MLVSDFLPSVPPSRPKCSPDADRVCGSVADTRTSWRRGSLGKFVVLDVPQGSTGGHRAAARPLPRCRDRRDRGLDQIGGEQIGASARGARCPIRRAIPRDPAGLAHPRAAAAVLASDLANAIPGTPSTITISGQYDFTRTRCDSRPATWWHFARSDPALRNEYVSLSAHHDHVGFDRSPVDHDSLRAFNRVVRPMAPTRRCARRRTPSGPKFGRFSTACAP